MRVGSVYYSTPTLYASGTRVVREDSVGTCHGAFGTKTGATEVVTSMGAAEPPDATAGLITARTFASLNSRRAMSVTRSVGAVVAVAGATEGDGGGC